MRCARTHVRRRILSFEQVAEQPMKPVGVPRPAPTLAIFSGEL